MGAPVDGCASGPRPPAHKTHVASRTGICVGILRAMLYRLRCGGPGFGCAGEVDSLRLILHWILSAIALIVVSHLVPGFQVNGVIPALIAAVVIGLLNATVGLVLKIITFPLAILTLGLFLLVVNGLMILLASAVVPGFHVHGLVPAFWGALVLALLGMLIKAVVKET